MSFMTSVNIFADLIQVNWQEPQVRVLSSALSAVARFSGTEGALCKLMKIALGGIRSDCIPKSSHLLL